MISCQEALNGAALCELHENAALQGNHRQIENSIDEQVA